MSVTKLKICGVKNDSEAKILAGLGVDLIGLNFVPSSSRCVSLKVAQNIMAVLRNTHVETVALFQDQPINLVNDYAKLLNVDYVQLHGNEDAAYLSQVIKPVIKAIPINDKMQFVDIINYIEHHPASYYLLDRAIQGQGPGVGADLAKKIIELYPGHIYLAGGITPESIITLRSFIKPLGIDIAGGVTTGNVIDMEKVKICLSTLRN